MKPLLVTPPFTQLNTPYPATAYLKGFLNTRGIVAHQADLGIEVILKLFSRRGLEDLFGLVKYRQTSILSNNCKRILALEQDYLDTIHPVIRFLQGQNPTLALQICQENYLPQASRFNQAEDLDWAFGTMGTHDKGRHLATLYLEDLGDLIVECLDPHFGFSRYAERLGRSANAFDEISAELEKPLTFIDQTTVAILHEKIVESDADILLVSVPFPGNLFSAFRCAQYVKKNFPHIKTVMGGGFPNTELRQVSDPRVFDFFDFITLDDGELPVELLLDYLDGKSAELKRTFLRENGKVVFRNDSPRHDYKQSQVGTPDYAGLPLKSYLSVIEVANPMHRLWSDGRWNKLTMAHGCYWGKCTFCDISLDYIKIYEPVAASILCDRMETLIAQTGETGFHFVDEAAPPALMRALALEILKRRLQVTWWTNIRFEKSFTADLCRLLRASGCIAVSGGLEVASDRLLALIEKGVTVAQVARVTNHFTQSGIMVHAYLMYGYPTQTVQETVDSLEMVRQLFAAGVLQSGFWHQFALTAHSPVGLEPERFGVVIDDPAAGTFANNDLAFTDKTGIDHGKFSDGLRKSLFNFMHGIGFEWPLGDWFGFRIPRTTVAPDFIGRAIADVSEDFTTRPTAKIVWIGNMPLSAATARNKKGRQWEILSLEFFGRTETFSVTLEKAQGEWLLSWLPKLTLAQKPVQVSEIERDYESRGLEDFPLFWHSKPMVRIRRSGLLTL